jgi:NADPH-dependent F420 reductase
MSEIAILGGTGRLGSGLALRWARAGHQVLLGSRRADKAERIAAQLAELVPGTGTIIGMDNLAAAVAGDLAVLSVPYPSQLSILETVRDALVGKLLITVVVPLRPPAVSVAWRPPAGSAAQEAQTFLGEGTPVLIAFQNISAVHLAELDHKLEADVLICGEKRSHKELVATLVLDAGLRPIDAGPLANAAVVEGLTTLLIGVNRHYKARGTSLRITGLEDLSQGR